ncbi:hypothetical protein ACF8O8_25720 [Pseudomonas sp. TYF_14]|uniref:hypothetical protein n=1 Tax=Pseudomonas sp. TYF_14 TaxID=3367193 RepID=UPI00370B4A04
MKLITQFFKTDCVIACLSMLTGHTYKHLLATFPGAIATGVTISEAHAFMLTNFGPACYASTANYQDLLFGKRAGRVALNQHQLWQQIQTRPAILSVPTESGEGAHCVLWTGTCCFDPWPGRGFIQKPELVYEAVWIDRLPLVVEFETDDEDA